MTKRKFSNIAYHPATDSCRNTARRILMWVTLIGSIGTTISQKKASAVDNATVVVAVYDVGETLMFLPVEPLLAESGIQVKWMPMTPWSQRLLVDRNVDLINPPDNLDAMDHLKDRHHPSSTDHWQNSLSKLSPDLVVFGLVSQIQADLARAIGATAIPTVGIYDGFDPPDGNSITLRVSKQVDRVLVPTDRIAKGLRAFGIKNVDITGQPSLETWRRIGNSLCKANVYQKLGIPTDRRVVLFAGQYGDSYDAILSAFLNSIRQPDGRIDATFVLTAHPRTDGNAEKKAIAEHLSDLPLIHLAPREVPTVEVATIADVVVTWRSTVGVQAAFMGRPVVYFDLGESNFNNDLIECGIAKKATEKSLIQILRRQLDNCVSPVQRRQQMSDLGFVFDADRKIAETVIQLVRSIQGK